MLPRTCKNTPDLRHPHFTPPHPLSGSTSAAPTGNGLEVQPPAISKQLLVPLLPCASPGVVPLGSTPETFPGLRPSSSEGTAWWT